MPNPTAPSTLTSLQVIQFAGLANDKRIVQEVRDLVESLGVMPERVAKMTYEPAVKPRTAKIAFTLYVLNEEDQRFAVHDDGSPHDPSSGLPWHYVTTVQRVNFKGELPFWWDQAVLVEGADLIGVQ